MWGRSLLGESASVVYLRLARVSSNQKILAASDLRLSVISAAFVPDLRR